MMEALEPIALGESVMQDEKKLQRPLQQYSSQVL